MDRRLTPLMRRSFRQLRRDRLLARDGPAGRLADLHLDDRDWRVRHLVAAIGGWLAARRVLVAPQSVDGPASGEGVLRLALSRAGLEQAADEQSERPVFRQIEIAEAMRLGYPYYFSDFGLWGATAGRDRDEAARALHAELARGDPHLRSAAALLGCRAEARGGWHATLEDFVIDARTWTVCALVLDTRRWRPGGRLRASPALVEGIDWRSRRLRFSEAPR